MGNDACAFLLNYFFNFNINVPFLKVISCTKYNISDQKWLLPLASYLN